MEPMMMTPQDYIAILKRRKWSLILPTVMIALAAAVTAMILPPVYQSMATILIEEQEVPQDFVMTTVTSYAEQRIQSINQRIMSFPRLLEIIERFDLYPGMKAKRSAEDMVEKMRQDVVLEPFSADVVDPRTGRPTKATIAFNLSYEGKNPQKVQQVVNVLTSLFMEENLKTRVKQVEETSEFLENELQKLSAERDELDTRMAAFKQQHLSELPEMMQVNLQSLNTVERNIGVANEQLRALKERETNLQFQQASVPPYILKEEQTIGRQRLEQLKIELVNLEQRVTDKHPDIRKTRAEIADLEADLAESAAGNGKAKEPPDNPVYINLSIQLINTRSEIKSIQRQLNDLEAGAAAYRQRIAASPAAEGQYNELLAARTTTQAKYNDLKSKLMEARVATGLEKEQKGERFTLIDPARLPQKPFKPNRLAIVLIGLVLGIGAGVGFSALKEFSDDSVHNLDRLEFETQLPVLTAIPVILTPADLTRRRRQRLALAFGSVGAAAAAMAVWHFFVMDLVIVWSKFMYRLAL
jgi:polysaccharide chain length determinant protein (PEP-CTERM system associated)